MTSGRHAQRTVHPFLRGLLPAACCVLIAACGTAPKRSVYYQNDGPPEQAPADLGDAADAAPRVEPLHPRANRPYTALGRSYTPLTGDVPFRQRGVASWYGRQFHGNRTASGEIYDMFAMTAAHPTLPIPSYVRVTNPRNGRSVIVRVNDRGPFKDDRVIDLSYAAATRLGIAAAGLGEVEVERLTNTQIASGEWRRLAQAGEPVGGQDGGSQPAAPGSTEGAPVPTPALASSLAPAAPAGRWSVQVGAFSQPANAEAFAARVAAVLGVSEADPAGGGREARVEHDQGLYRVLVGALPDRASALQLARQLEQLLGRPAVPFGR